MPIGRQFIRLERTILIQQFVAKSGFFLMGEDAVLTAPAN